MASETIGIPIVESAFSSSFQRLGCVNETTNRLRTDLPKSWHLELLRDALQQTGCHVIYKEVASGKNVSQFIEKAFGPNDVNLPSIANIAPSWRKELAEGGASGRLFAESLATVLAVHIYRTYGEGKGRLQIAKGGLGPVCFNRVQRSSGNRYGSARSGGNCRSHFRSFRGIVKTIDQADTVPLHPRTANRHGVPNCGYVGDMLVWRKWWFVTNIGRSEGAS